MGALDVSIRLDKTARPHSEFMASVYMHVHVHVHANEQVHVPTCRLHSIIYIAQLVVPTKHSVQNISGPLPPSLPSLPLLSPPPPLYLQKDDDLSMPVAGSGSGSFLMSSSSKSEIMSESSSSSE